MIDKAKLGEVIFDVITSEDPQDNAEITDKPVEYGSDISDHHRPDPSVLHIAGAFTDHEANKNLQQLRKYYLESKLLTYTGRNIYENVVIQSLSRKHNADNRLGFNFLMTLRVIRLSKSQTFEFKAVSPKTKKKSKKTSTQVKKTTQKGRQQPKPKPVSTPPKPAQTRFHTSTAKSPADFPKTPLEVMNNTFQIYGIKRR